MLPEVIIVGRPNVGKSTLFNRLCRRRNAIVLDTPGITRDLLYSVVQWKNCKFQLIDSGGLELFTKDTIVHQIKEKVLQAIKDASLVLYMVDISSVALDVDKEIIQLLKRSNKPIIIVVNKIDNPSLESEGYKFYELGIEKVYFISAEHARGIGSLLDGISETIPETTFDEEREEEIKIAVIGRPNVGKSSLVNSILGSDRVLVNEEPGTTRDSVDIIFNYNNNKFRLIDTAGIRPKSKLFQKAEIISVLKARKSLERADIVLLIIDASQGFTTQDAALGGLAYKAGRGLLLVVNKWDLIKENSELSKNPENYLREKAKFLSYAPIAFVSAKTGENVFELLYLIMQIQENQCKRIPTGVLNQFLQKKILQLKPPYAKKGAAKIYYLTQINIKPPTFIAFVNYRNRFSTSYINYMKNKLREGFGFRGTPIDVKLKKRT